MPSAPATDVGSERLAAALAAADPVAIGRALRHDVVVVPLTRGPQDETQILTVLADDPVGDRRSELHLFSSTATFAAWAADRSAGREFALERGERLAPVLDAYAPILRRVVFDTAGPHPMSASPEDVRASLSPQPGDDEVEWITTGAEHGLRPGERARGIDLFLTNDWAQIDLSGPASIDADTKALVEAQIAALPAAPVLRGQLIAWLRQSARTAAAGGGRSMAYLTRRTSEAAASVAVTTYWQQLGTPPSGGHLAAMGQRLQQEKRPEDALVEASTAAGPLLRLTHRGVGPAELALAPVGIIDYWLQSPDGESLCLVSFSTPHLEQLLEVQRLADAVLLSAAWELAPAPEEPGR